MSVTRSDNQGEVAVTTQYFYEKQFGESKPVRWLRDVTILVFPSTFQV